MRQGHFRGTSESLLHRKLRHLLWPPEAQGHPELLARTRPLGGRGALAPAAAWPLRKRPLHPRNPLFRRPGTRPRYPETRPGRRSPAPEILAQESLGEASSCGVAVPAEAIALSSGETVPCV